MFIDVAIIKEKRLFAKDTTTSVSSCVNGACRWVRGGATLPSCKHHLSDFPSKPLLLYINTECTCHICKRLNLDSIWYCGEKHLRVCGRCFWTSAIPISSVVAFLFWFWSRASSPLNPNSHQKQSVELQIGRNRTQERRSSPVQHWPEDLQSWPRSVLDFGFDEWLPWRKWPLCSRGSLSVLGHEGVRRDAEILPATLLGSPFFIDNTSLENIARPGSLLTYSNNFWCYCIFFIQRSESRIHFWQLHYSTLILVQENRLARISALMAIICWRKKSWLFSYSTFKSNSVPPTANWVFPKFSPFQDHPPPPRWQDKRH